jgi:hypothetical protein
MDAKTDKAGAPSAALSLQRPNRPMSLLYQSLQDFRRLD